MTQRTNTAAIQPPYRSSHRLVLRWRGIWPSLIFISALSVLGLPVNSLTRARNYANIQVAINAATPRNTTTGTVLEKEIV